MIVQSEDTWQAGWAKLLSILGNAKKFYAGAGDAAEALPSGEAAVTTCIDFYGTNRMAEVPETLVYLSPKGQTSFNPDPIAILKNPPNPVARSTFRRLRVCPRTGRRLWALPVGHPTRAEANRARPTAHPQRRLRKLRRAVALEHRQSLRGRARPWRSTPSCGSDSYGLLRQLVWAAAVRNVDFLKAAKQKLIDTDFDPSASRCSTAAGQRRNPRGGGRDQQTA